MVIESSYHMIVRSRVEHFPNLLQEALPVELSRTSEGILPQKNVFSLQSCVETTSRGQCINETY